MQRVSMTQTEDRKILCFEYSSIYKKVNFHNYPKQGFENLLTYFELCGKGTKTFWNIMLEYQNFLLYASETAKSLPLYYPALKMTTLLSVQYFNLQMLYATPLFISI